MFPTMLALLLLLVPLSAGADAEKPRPGSGVEGLAAEPGKPGGEAAKVSAPIRAVVRSLERAALGLEATPGSPDAPATPGVRVNANGEIHVYVLLTDFRAEYVARLEALGLRVEIALPEHRLVQGWVAAPAVGAVAAEPFVKQVRPPDYRERESTGGAGTEGEGILRADLARSTFGVDGTGVMVGVISDGVEFLVSSIQTGDLPSVQVLNPGSGNEGTAMLEIVHDLAPGAALAFYGPDTSADMVVAINALAAAGARIIVDDLSFFSEPKFQDGMVAQTIRQFARDGRVYAGSAGNRAKQHYRASYARLAGTGTPNDTYPAVHDYAPGTTDIGNTITIRPGCRLSVTLQWSNPWGGAFDDFDLFIMRSSDGAILARGDDTQTGTQDPVEFAGWTNTTGASVAVFILVAEAQRTTPADQLVLDYFARPNCGEALEYVTAAQSVSGNHAVEEMFSVAAVGAATPTVAQDYSSQGPHDIFFPAFQRRYVPNITAVDCVQTRTGQLGHFSNPFCGTSAAAPHVAGIAALVAEASPGLDSVQVQQLVHATALDLNGPGYDLTYGWGRIDAFDAIQASPLSPVTQVSTSGTQFSAGQTITVGLFAHNPAGNPTLDLYAGVLLPDGFTIVYFAGPGGFGGVGDLRAPSTVAPLAAAGSGFFADVPVFLQFTFPAAGLPAGTYTLFAGFFRPGALLDNAIAAGELVALHVAEIVYFP